MAGRARIQRVEVRRQAPQNVIDHLSDRAQRMTAGTHCSEEISLNIGPCCRSSPRTRTSVATPESPHANPMDSEFFSILLMCRRQNVCRLYRGQRCARGCYPTCKDK
jgi:hypothetical protein